MRRGVKRYHGSPIPQVACADCVFVSDANIKSGFVCPLHGKPREDTVIACGSFERRPVKAAMSTPTESTREEDWSTITAAKPGARLDSRRSRAATGRDASASAANPRDKRDA